MARVIHTPGAAHAADVPDDDLENEHEDVVAKLARLEAENAALRASTVKPVVLGVFEPVTPNGAKNLAASAYAEMTTAELMAKIDAGEVKEPITSALCKDGYYAARRAMG